MSGVIATLAIWGEKFRNSLAGPKIDLSLRPGPGDLHYSREGKKMLYHHILVEDQRRWSPVKQFRLLVDKIERRGPADTYFAEYRGVDGPRLLICAELELPLKTAPYS